MSGNWLSDQSLAIKRRAIASRKPPPIPFAFIVSFQYRLFLLGSPLDSFSFVSTIEQLAEDISGVREPFEHLRLLSFDLSL